MISPIISMAVKIILALVLPPLIGGLIAGIDRKITARMQSRQGPPIMQPFYDVLKLMRKESTDVNAATRFYVAMFLFFMIFTAVLFFSGGDLLLVVFSLTLSSIFLVVAGYSSFSPFSLIGTERELLQIMAYEPMILIMSFSLYMVSKSFFVGDVFKLDAPIVLKLPLIFLGLVYALTFKLRKSPFDLSTSHHGHQEIVKGITTEFTGPTLAMTEVAHWYETVLALGFVYIFFASNKLYSNVIALFACAAVYFIEIVVDNSFARVKWQTALEVSWLVTFIFSAVNIFVLSLFIR